MQLNERQFEKFKELIYKASGINLDGKAQLLETRLAKWFRKTGETSIDDYLFRLSSDPVELSSFIDVIATTHTFFFRESKPYEYIDKDSCRSIWCAACASGEEPYSILIDCLEKGFAPYILATDISGKILEKAETGIYPEDRLRHISRPLKDMYFIAEQNFGETFYKIRSELKKQVVFEQSNLLTDAAPERHFDIIFCRNVMIYFDLATKNRLVEKLYYALRPEGYFIIGGAESLSLLEHRFHFIAPSVYQKPSSPHQSDT